MSKYEAYQGALDRLLNDDYDFENDPYNENRVSAWEKDADLIQELVDKQKPKKFKMMRIKKYDGYNIGFCQCGAVLYSSMIEEQVNYCHKCGQAIDWSNEDE